MYFYGNRQYDPQALLINYQFITCYITCDDCNCKSAEHKLQIDQVYMQLCAVLEKASRECIPSFTVDSFRDGHSSFYRTCERITHPSSC